METTQLPRFREDNTEGYDDADLVELNRRYERAIADPSEFWATVFEPGRDALAYKSWTDRVAEAVQATYDDEQ